MPYVYLYLWIIICRIARECVYSKEIIVFFYRIPGIVVSKSGTVIVYCEERDSKSDWARINLVYRRSTDGGKSWELPRTIVEGKKLGITANNPVMIADYVTGKIHCLYVVEYGIGPYGGIFYTYSADDGISWSAPVNLTQITLPDIRNVFAVGPGHGIQLRDGTLIVSAWMVLKVENQPLKSHHPAVVSTIYSKDFGKTWKLGELIWPTETVTDPNESTLVELSDGRVMINCRNESKEKYRATSRSRTGYSDWDMLTLDENLEDPVCFGSLVRYDNNVILFSNCASQQKRENVTVRVSYNDGISWDGEKLLISADGGYSDIACDHNQQIYVLAESRKQETYSIDLWRFNMQWLLSDKMEVKQ